MPATLHRAALAAVLLIGAASGIASAQQSTSTTRETGNALTGGAEGNTTDAGTPRGTATGAVTQTQPPTSGASGSANTLTGGAEGNTTDKGTPTGPASGAQVVPENGKRPHLPQPRN